MKAIKRIIALLLALTFTVALFACGQTTDEPRQSGDSGTKADTQSDTESETEDPSSGQSESETEQGQTFENPVSLLTGSKIFFKCVSSYEKTKLVDIGLIDAFISEFESRLGVVMETKTDRYEVKESSRELLVGETNRAQSIKLLADIEAAGGFRAGIYVDGNKIAVAGNSYYMTYVALCELLDHHIVTDSKGALNITFEDGYEWISEEGKGYPDPVEAAQNDQKLTFFFDSHLVETLSPTASINGRIVMFSTLQGGGSDGTYCYVAQDNEPNAIILKYDMATWELVGQSQALPIGHANDITYDSKRNRLVISDCTADMGWCGIHFVDPETLTLIETITVGFGNAAVEYIPETDQYLLGAGGDGSSNYQFALTDGDFNILRRFEGSQDPNLVNQGFMYDQSLIFAPRYAEEGTVQYVAVYDMDGTLYGHIPSYDIPEPSTEVEFMFRWGEVFVIGLNGGDDKVGAFYLIPENWW